MDLEGLVGRARGGDLEAFAELTRRFQQMAFGYALALLHDLPQAEDVVQEAFVAAWFGLRTLADPAAFPGWFRSIVRHQAHRLLRQKHWDALPLDAAAVVPAGDSAPDARLEQAQRIATVLDAIDPEHALLAARVRDALVAAASDGTGPQVPPAGATDPVKRRARKLWLFFAQPFFVGEPYTRRPGVFVSRADALRGCREILDGVHDDLPDEAFYFTGGIDEVRARAAELRDGKKA